MNSISTSRRIVLALLVTAFSAGMGQSFAAAPEPSMIPEANTRVEIHDTHVNGFVHPGIGLTKAILDNARMQVIAKREPWYAGYQEQASHRFSARSVGCRNQSKTDPTKPDYDALDSQSMEARFSQDASRAYHQALMYYFTGDEIYRANAMTVIRVWSNMNPAKFKYYNDAHIHSGYPLREMLIAAELMQSTDVQNPSLVWIAEDTRKLTDNLITPCITHFMNSNGWFMNQTDYALSGATAGFIFTNNRDGYNQRVEWFTINKDAPNPGWSGSILHLARLVDTNAKTGEKLAKPVVQLAEMGRDQAHAADDVELFVLISRMMMAQGTKVDPVQGTVSTSANAIGPYEFLNDRILAAADFFCRFMLGYDTPWVPVAYDMTPEGKINAIYPRIADGYRGRLTFDIGGLYYYYTYVRGIDVAVKAPYFYEAFTKRRDNGEWIYIPKEVTGEGARVIPPPADRDVIEVEKQFTALNANSKAVHDGNESFIRVTPMDAGTRLAILRSDNDSKMIGLRIRTQGVARLEMSGFAKPWILPNTHGQWRNVTYTLGTFEHFGNIVYFNLKSQSSSPIDIDQLLLKADSRLKPPAFVMGDTDLQSILFAGAPVAFDFSAKQSSAAGGITYSSLDKPEHSALNPETGAFSWTPATAGEYSFIVEASDGSTVSLKNVRIVVAPNRLVAVQKVAAVYHPDTAYVAASLARYKKAYDQTMSMLNSASNAEFFSQLVQLQHAAESLEWLTPRLADGSMDFPGLVASSNIGKSIALLTDGNDDTYPVYTLAKDLNYIFDFGSRFKISASAFAIEGRLNFENRAMDVAFFGSNDNENWIRLTPQSTPLATELSIAKVDEKLQSQQFRYLKIQKLSKQSAPIFEPSELRIYGQRHEQ